MSAGFLLALAYAITDQKRLVLAVLGILGVCTILPELVCLMFIPVTGMCDGRILQARAGLNSCNLTSAQLHAITM